MFEYQSGQTKDCTFGICCLSTKYTVYRSKNKGWFVRNQDDVSEWSDMFIFTQTVVSVSQLMLI